MDELAKQLIKLRVALNKNDKADGLRIVMDLQVNTYDKINKDILFSRRKITDLEKQVEKLKENERLLKKKKVQTEQQEDPTIDKYNDALEKLTSKILAKGNNKLKNERKTVTVPGMKKQKKRESNAVGEKMESNNVGERRRRNTEPDQRRQKRPKNRNLKKLVVHI